MPKNHIAIPGVDYMPAQLINSSNEWVIYYYVIDPSTGKLRRIRHKFNRIKSLTARRQAAKIYMAELNRKLSAGWNPLLDPDTPYAMSSLKQAMDRFYKQKLQEGLKPDTQRTYRSYIRSLRLWIRDTGQEDITVMEFNRDRFRSLEYMNYIFFERQVANRTYNNYLKFYRILFNWMVLQGYTNKNYFTKLPTKRNEPKARDYIDDLTRFRISEHLSRYQPRMYICSLLVYHTLIRPREVTLLRPEDFDLENQVIRIRSSVAKTGKERITTIPDTMMEHLEGLDLDLIPIDWYVFGTNSLDPSPKPFQRKRFSPLWARMRKALRLEDSIKFYSLRDTGIINLLRDGVSPEEVMKQAGHSSLAMTTVYANHVNPKGSESIKELSSQF